MPADLMAIEDLRFRYENSDWEIGGISLSLGRGELLAIIGPNGSGKSTLLKLCAGVLAPSGGRVVLDGSKLATLDRADVARTLGYLPQQVAYTFDYLVEEVVGMGRFPHLTGMGFLSEQDVRIIARSMGQTETSDYRGRRISQLSGGERQRVFLASVLAQEPRILLLDEPTSALDIHHQVLFFRLLRRLARNGMGMAVVTHDLNLASLHCDRLLLLANGRTAIDGEPDAVIRPDVLSEVYGEHILVDRDPRTGRPFVLPLPGDAGEDNGGHAQ